MKVADRYSRLCEKRKTEYVGFDLTWVWKSPFKPFIFRKDDIFPPHYVKFEDTEFPIANHPHEYLCTAIAPSYMTPPPEDKRVAKHIGHPAVNRNSYALSGYSRIKILRSGSGI